MRLVEFGCGPWAALGSSDLILQTWWLSPFTSPSKMDGKTAFSEGDEDHDDFGAKAANSFGPFAGRAARGAASREKPRPTGIGHSCLPRGRIPRRNCGYVPGPGTGRRFRRHCLLPGAPD